MGHQYSATDSTKSNDTRSAHHPVLGPDTCHAFQSASPTTFPRCRSGNLHQQLQGASQNTEHRPGFSNSKQSLFLAGAPERKFGAEPIYPTYPFPPFVSPENLGAPPTSPIMSAFGQSPTSTIDSRGSFGEQMDMMFAMTSAKQEHEDALTKQLWEQYDARACTASRNSRHDNSAPKSVKRGA